MRVTRATNAMGLQRADAKLARSGNASRLREVDTAGGHAHTEETLVYLPPDPRLPHREPCCDPVAIA